MTPRNRSDGPPGFAAFAAARYPALARLGALLAGDVHRGEDLAQDGLLAVLRGWHKLHPDGDPEAYARVAMARGAARAARRRWRGEVATGALPETAAGSAPEDEVLAAERARALLRDLPAHQRVTLVLRFWCDLSEDQTAAVLRCSPGTVKSRTSRALTRLRADLAGAGLDLAGAPAPTTTSAAPTGPGGPR